MRLATQVTNRPNRLVRQAGPIHPSLENQRQITLPLAQRSRMSSKNAVRPPAERAGPPGGGQRTPGPGQGAADDTGSNQFHRGSFLPSYRASIRALWVATEKVSATTRGPVGPPAGQLGGVCHDGLQGGGQAGPGSP